MTVTYKFSSRREAAGAMEDEAVPSGPVPAKGVAAGMRLAEPAAERAVPEGETPPVAGEGHDPASTANDAARGIAVGGSRNLPVKWSPPRSRLILVGKARGGAGATSVATNLAMELQKGRGLFRGARARRVALVDLDVQFGNAASFLDLEDRGGMLELLRLAGEPDAQAVRNAMLKHPSGLNVLAAPRMAVPLEALDIQRTEAIIAALMSEHDYVVVDLPPALVPWLEPLLRRASRLLMVSDLAVPSIVCARRVIDLMHEDNPDLPVEIVVSREKKPVFQRRIHRQASTALGLPLAHWLPDEPRLSRLALDRGEPMATLAPRCPWSKAVRHIASSLEARMLAEARQ